MKHHDEEGERWDITVLMVQEEGKRKIGTGPIEMAK